LQRSARRPPLRRAARRNPRTSRARIGRAGAAAIVDRDDRRTRRDTCWWTSAHRWQRQRSLL